MKIISASRRTDIPAFYGDWFMNRIAAGTAIYTNPFNGVKYSVSLKKENVAAIALWSKNFTPFIQNAIKLKELGYPLFFNYTITGLPPVFEPAAPPAERAIETLKILSDEFTPDSINWRYDPVLISDITGEDYHCERFEQLCRSLSGYVKRCYISFPTPYGKVERSFARIRSEAGITIITPDTEQRISIARKLSSIAAEYSVTVYSCCSDYLAGGGILKGHCIDGSIISSVYGIDLSMFKARPTRRECGCTESVDIGVYDSCPHGCIYCYANSNREKASAFYQEYISDRRLTGSEMLSTGMYISDSPADEKEKKPGQKDHNEPFQPELFK